MGLLITHRLVYTLLGCFINWVTERRCMRSSVVLCPPVAHAYTNTHCLFSARPSRGNARGTRRWKVSHFSSSTQFICTSHFQFRLSTLSNKFRFHWSGLWMKEMWMTEPKAGISYEPFGELSSSTAIPLDKVMTKC